MQDNVMVLYLRTSIKAYSGKHYRRGDITDKINPHTTPTNASGSINSSRAPAAFDMPARISERWQRQARPSPIPKAEKRCPITGISIHRAASFTDVPKHRKNQQQDRAPRPVSSHIQTWYMERDEQIWPPATIHTTMRVCKDSIPYCRPSGCKHPSHWHYIPLLYSTAAWWCICPISMGLLSGFCWTMLGYLPYLLEEIHIVYRLMIGLLIDENIRQQL